MGEVNLQTGSVQLRGGGRVATYYLYNRQAWGFYFHGSHSVVVSFLGEMLTDVETMKTGVGIPL